MKWLFNWLGLWEIKATRALRRNQLPRSRFEGLVKDLYVIRSRSKGSSTHEDTGGERMQKLMRLRGRKTQPIK
ncbi:hypothetical protein Scep_022069 [Stephania cephalantha]|uniref:Uncharacterized protein n=1 Tax=Stephania cephalantha TaxID=152367 RepID=A0AAP0I1Y8_9MAGN